MSSILGFLIASTTLIVRRVIIALGLTTVVMTGITELFTEAVELILTNIEGFPVAILQLAGLGGAWVALSYLVAAVNFVVIWISLTKLSQFVSGRAAANFEPFRNV